MKQETTQFLYLIDSRLGLALGVAPDPQQRLRELQVGSPVRLELVLTTPYPRREDARAVVAELARRFAARWAHGQWYRVTRAEVERALAGPPLPAAPARAARARPAASAGKAPTAGPARASRPRTAKERAYQRRRRAERTAKQKRAARLLARGTSQVAVAATVGVTARTLRNWSRTPAFARMRERARAGGRREPEQAPPRARRAPAGARAGTGPAGAPGAAAASSAVRPRPAASVRVGGGGVPLFPDTPEGRAARLAYYEARKLDRLPDSLYDYNDVVLLGRETPAERRARQGRTGRR